MGLCTDSSSLPLLCIQLPNCKKRRFRCLKGRVEGMVRKRAMTPFAVTGRPLTERSQVGKSSLRTRKVAFHSIPEKCIKQGETAPAWPQCKHWGPSRLDDTRAMQQNTWLYAITEVLSGADSAGVREENTANFWHHSSICRWPRPPISQERLGKSKGTLRLSYYTLA